MDAQKPEGAVPWTLELDVIQIVLQALQKLPKGKARARVVDYVQAVEEDMP